MASLRAKRPLLPLMKSVLLSLLVAQLTTSLAANPETRGKSIFAFVEINPNHDVKSTYSSPLATPKSAFQTASFSSFLEEAENSAMKVVDQTNTAAAVVCHTRDAEAGLSGSAKAMHELICAAEDAAKQSEERLGRINRLHNMNANHHRIERETIDQARVRHLMGNYSAAVHRSDYIGNQADEEKTRELERAQARQEEEAAVTLTSMKSQARSMTQEFSKLIRKSRIDFDVEEEQLNMFKQEIKRLKHEKRQAESDLARTQELKAYENSRRNQSEAAVTVYTPYSVSAQVANDIGSAALQTVGIPKLNQDPNSCFCKFDGEIAHCACHQGTYESGHSALIAELAEQIKAEEAKIDKILELRAERDEKIQSMKKEVMDYQIMVANEEKQYDTRVRFLHHQVMAARLKQKVSDANEKRKAEKLRESLNAPPSL